MGLRRLLPLLLSIMLALTGAVVSAPAATAATTSGLVVWGEDAANLTVLPQGLKAADIVQIAAGGHHLVALKSNGTVAAWGSNAYGQSKVPKGLKNVVAITAGDSFSVALKSNGTVTVWGGSGSTSVQPPKGLKGVVMISSSSSAGHILALRKNGTVVGWGTNGDGQSKVPSDAKNVKALAAGAWHSVAITKGGWNIGWGENQYGQALGLAGAGTLTAIAAGAVNSIGITKDGRVVAVGSPKRKVLAVPAATPNAKAIAMGWWFAMALTTSGRVFAWGDNNYGQLNVPAGLKQVRLIAAGQAFGVAVYGPAPKAGPFADVPGSHLHAKNIAWLKAQGITKPADGRYKPSADVNRAAMMTFLYRIANPGKAIPKCSVKPFSDVSMSSDHCGAVTWAKSKKILPSSPKNMGAAKAVTRADMAVYMYKLAKNGKTAPRCKSAPFEDVSQSASSCGYIQWAKVTKITSGVSAAKYAPDKTVNRGSMASFLHRLYDYVHKK